MKRKVLLFFSKLEDSKLYVGTVEPGTVEND